jgi:hypothetical protein
MKKFSNITNQKVGTEPKKEVKIDEAQVLKSKMISLMNQFLSISFHGSNDYRLLGGGSKIKGQEMLAEAIIDLLSDSNKKEQTKLLESLKTEITDWKVIDEKIEEINKENTKLSLKKKINSIFEKYSSDEGTLLLVIESTYSKIENTDLLSEYNKHISSLNVNSSLKGKLNDIYQTRAKQLLS